jgi:hypothetical protein
MRYNLPPEQRAQLLDEQRKDREAAIAFERLCRENKPELLYQCANLLGAGFDAWRLAFARVAKLGRVSPKIQAAFVNIWIEKNPRRMRAIEQHAQTQRCNQGRNLASWCQRVTSGSSKRGNGRSGAVASALGQAPPTPLSLPGVPA